MASSDVRPLLAVAALAVVGIGVVAATTGDDPAPVAAATTAPSLPLVDASSTTIVVQAQAQAQAQDGPTTTVAGTDVPTAGGDEDGCFITERSLRIGSSGPSVECLQQALTARGYSVTLTGQYDTATALAVEALQTDKNLYVDGIAGRETGIQLGIWPDEATLVVHTPVPAAGAVDLMGYPLSSVASAGADAPPLPPNSGTGRRLVYSRSGQRLWAVDDQGRIVRSWLVSGSKYENETPGTHEVYSRSEMSTAWNGKAYLPLMVRWLDTERGAIGMHSIPLHVEDNSVYQTEAELGQRLSGGCQRQAPRDARFVWDFAQIGTKVVVV